ncbi:hypothetical protein AOLI_G00107880 [Acnodon oligacanthus]
MGQHLSDMPVSFSVYGNGQLRRFIASRRCPYELWSDQGTDFKGEREREIWFIKAALQAVFGNQSVTEKVLRTVLTETEGNLQENGDTLKREQMYILQDWLEPVRKHLKETG